MKIASPHVGDHVHIRGVGFQDFTTTRPSARGRESKSTPFCGAAVSGAQADAFERAFLAASKEQHWARATRAGRIKIFKRHVSRNIPEYPRLKPKRPWSEKRWELQFDEYVGTLGETPQSERPSATAASRGRVPDPAW